MSVDVVIEDLRWESVGLPDIAERAADAALRHLGMRPDVWEIALLACDDGRIAALNADFRGKPAPTNVLSWPAEERGAAEPGMPPDVPDPDTETELGDIAISFDTMARETADQDVSLADHATHLIVHAVLHLLGYDHEDDRDAALMERLEVEILASLGVADPY